MSEEKKKYEVAILVEQVNSMISEYNLIINSDTSYQVRKDMRVKMRQIQTEINRLNSLPAY